VPGSGQDINPRTLQHKVASQNWQLRDPFSLCVQENLVDLNARLAGAGEAELPMNRFRPNIVLAGGGSPAWADDTWQSITISSNGVANAGSSGAGGSTVLQYVKPCSRCKVRTTCPMILLMLYM
jgi:uncharacterized protein YcbX